ncbi:MAG: Flavohemoprotein [Syntrophaceae bacterium PtaU1.Bin231]|nr:MAG: Flavohemoprotein [Syntrophaceae bacterium PtaU1.Bin231]
MAEKNTERNIWKVVKVVPENHDITSIYLEGTDEKFARRFAGQFASIMVKRGEGWSEAHPFTISAAPEDANLRFTIKKEGSFTSAVPDLKPGDPVKCMGPLGVFCKNIDTKPRIVMLAGGVGITPFLSALRHFVNAKAGNAVTLFWVNKTLADTFAADEIGGMTRQLNLTVVHCLSREEDVQRFFHPAAPRVLYEAGRLNADILKKHGFDKEAAFYLCGPPPMMESALADLGGLGVPPETVNSEKFAYGKPAK